MTKDNEDALRCADALECTGVKTPAAHLRRLVAENEAKDALLRQAVEAMEGVIYWDNEKPEWQDARTAIAAIRQQPAPQPLTADDLHEPKNGQQWRVVWWNESCRMMLPVGLKVDRYKGYRNGTMQFTLKRAHGIKEQP